MIETSVAAVTVSVVELDTAPDAAVISDEPGATPVATPAALIVANAGVAELHVTAAVKFCVEPSVNVPVAVNACVSPAAIDGFAGVTATDTSVGAVTVSTVEPDTFPKTAEIVEVPALSAVASPALLIEATAGVPDAQATLPVIFAVLPSL